MTDVVQVAEHERHHGETRQATSSATQVLTVSPSVALRAEADGKRNKIIIYLVIFEEHGGLVQVHL